MKQRSRRVEHWASAEWASARLLIVLITLRTAKRFNKSWGQHEKPHNWLNVDDLCACTIDLGYGECAFWLPAYISCRLPPTRKKPRVEHAMFGENHKPVTVCRPRAFHQKTPANILNWSDWKPVGLRRLLRTTPAINSTSPKQQLTI